MSYADSAIAELGVSSLFSEDPERRAASLREAQVYATLELAEQTRVANIIALASLRIAPDGVPALRHLAVQPKDDYCVEPTDEIKEALRL